MLKFDGSFKIEGIPPGSWDLMLRYRQTREQRGGYGQWTTASLQPVELRDEETIQVHVDLSSFRPARLSGRIFLENEVYAGGAFRLQNLARDAAGNLVSRGDLGGLVTDAQGAFSDDLLPGLYRVVLSPEKRPWEMNGWIQGTSLAELQADQSVERVFHIVRRKLRVRFLESDGTPAVERFIEPSWLMDSTRTDADGWLVLDPAPVEPVTFYTWPRGLDLTTALRQAGQDEVYSRLMITLGPVQILPSQTEAEFTLTLPPDRE